MGRAPRHGARDIAADDVDQFADKVKKAGGKVHRAPADIPNVGRFAVVADPQGAVFMLFKGMAGAEPPPQPAGRAGPSRLARVHAG